MSEWWTYSLSDFLLFAPQTYYRLFELYNRDIWPLHLAALGLGAAIPVLLWRDPAWRGRAVAAILAASWIWVAWAYHLQRYAAINWAAPSFALGYGLEAALLIWCGLIRNRLVTPAVPPLIKRAGLGLLVFALVVHPLRGPLLGRAWVRAELFGIAPDPTAIATLGILLLADYRILWTLLPIPAAWCAISGATLWAMGAPDAVVAPLAAVVAIVLAGWKTRRERSRPR